MRNAVPVGRCQIGVIVDRASAGQADPTGDAPAADGTGEYFHVIRWRFVGSDEEFTRWSQWYDDVHVPAILAVPGMRSFTRYGQLGTSREFLTVWRMDGPQVFDQPAYAAARGWGPWENHIERWTISLLEHARAPRRFGAAGEGESPL